MMIFGAEDPAAILSSLPILVLTLVDTPAHLFPTCWVLAPAVALPLPECIGGVASRSAEEPPTSSRPISRPIMVVVMALIIMLLLAGSAGNFKLIMPALLAECSGRTLTSDGRERERERRRGEERLRRK